MPQSLANILVHVIFSTKNRQPLIAPDILPRLHGQLGAIIRHQEAVPLGIGGVEDHVHILLRLPPKIAFSSLVRDIKALSSKWMHETLDVPAFAWQSGYGAFSVSEMKVQETLQYIAGQREHHREVTFQDEFREFLRRHNIEFDERYVWD